METDSFSEDLEHVVNNQGISDIDFFQSVNGGREFNVSYHKVSGTRSEDTSKGKTHTAQLHAVPGFSHVVEEIARFLRTDPSLQVVDDTELDVERNAGKAKGNRLRKSMSRRPGNLTSGEGEQVLGSDLDMHDGCRRNGSHSSETFVAVSDISLRTIPSELPPPSRPPPVLDASRGHSSGFHSKSERVDDGETLGYSSPPFYDVEVDINSSSAAMKNAMHRPAAKLKNAEEFRGRKKGASETNTKSSYRVKNDEAKISEITRFDSLNDDRKQESCDVRSGNMKISATDESQKATKVAPETSEPLERERLVNMFEEKHIKESRSSLESDRSTAVGTWKEETEFFELVGTEEHGKVIRPINHTTSLMQDTKTYEHGRKVGEAPNIQEEYKNVKAIAEGYQVEDKKKSKAAKMALEQGKSIRKSKSSNEKYRQRENVKNDKMTEFFELQKNEKKTRTVHQHGKTGNIATKADQSDSLREIAETQHKEHQKVESAKSKEVDRQTRIEVQCSMDHKDNEKKLKEDEDQQLSVKRQKQKQSQKMKENGKIVREAFALGTAEGEERVKDSENLDRIDERVNEPLKIDRPEEKTTCKRENEIIFKQAKQIKSKKGLKEAYESKTIEKSLEGSFKKEESDQGLKYALGKIENEMGLEEDFELELSKKSTTEVFYQEGNEQYERDQAKEKCREVFNEYGKGNILKKAGHSEKIQKVQKQAPELERNGGNEAQRKKEIESPSNPAFDREGSVDISNEDSHAEKSEKMLKDTGSEKDKGLDKDLEQIQADGEGVDMEFSKEINETLETEYDESLLAAHSSSIHEEKMGKLEASEEPIADPENGKARTDCKVDEKKLEEIGVENLLANVRKQASEISLGDVEHSGTQSGRVDHKMTNADGLGFCSEKTCTEKTNIVSPMEFGPDSQERKLAHEWGERGNIKQHANAGLNHEQIREQESSSQANPCGDDRRNTVADAPGIVPKAASVQNSCQRSYVAHSTKSKDKSLDEIPAAVEKDAERTRREVELEKDRLRKIEEEIERERERHKDRMAVNRAMLEAEREREREKDRMAVDRATLEARDRAYTEARERAERAAFERATAEARQRALGEARERLEKACAEARDKSFADKAAAEAKLKAERAAVERATAEARERAMEKVKVERAVFESRERLERSVSEKFGVSFRNDGRQGSSSSVSVHLNKLVINYVIAC